MRHLLLLVAIVVSLLASPVAARQWTSRAGGFSVEAELVDVKDGKVILKKTDGSQISVPLEKLSLGDVQFISETLKAAEAAITGGRPASSAPAGAMLQAGATPEAAKPATVPPALLKKLHYNWQKGQSYVYRVRISGERGSATENRDGEVTYKVKSTQLDEIELAMTSKMRLSLNMHPSDYVLLPGRHVGFVTNIDGTREYTIRINPQGRVLDSRGGAPLPYLLGDLAELVIEPLPQAEQMTWTVQGDPGIAVVSAHYPYCRYPRAAFREGIPANEKTVYTVMEATGKLLIISKHYEMTSAATLGGKPRIEGTGDGKLKFDTERGAFASLDYDIRITVRDTNKTEETPLHLSYRLLSEQDIAEAEKEAKQAKEQARKAKQEKDRPLTDQELETALSDLTSDDAELVAAAAKLFAEKKPKSPNPKVAKALEKILLKDESVRHRTDAAMALKNWSTSENIPALIKAATDDRWPPVKSSAIEALCNYTPKEAIKPVAQQMINMQTRGAAVKFLKAIGPDAEDAVLALIDYKDAWVRAEVCQLLESIGTKKSIPALEKAVSDESWMVNGNARKALAVVKLR